MKYIIKDGDGDIYVFRTAKELLIALQRALGSEHEYYDNDLKEWFQE